MSFESLLSDQLRAYAEVGVRPIDRFAIAERTIATGRRAMGGRRLFGLGRSTRMLVLVGLLALALAATVVLIGSRLQTPTPYLGHTYVDELVSAPDLSAPMGRPVLALLEDGRVLAMSGDKGATPLIYDPMSGASVVVGPMVAPDRFVSSAVRLRDGRVLISGDGVTQIFDPAALQFSPLGPGVTARSGAHMAVLHDGRVLIAGGLPPGGNAGVDPAIRSAEVFDPAALTFTQTGSMSTPTGGGQMATLPDGRVYVATDPVAEVYDPRTGTFGAASSTSGGAGRPVVIPDGRVVLFGSTGLYTGGSIQVWDPISRTFAVQNLSEPLTDATLLDDGRIFVTGMCRGRPTGWTGVYDPSTGVTSSMQPTQACRPSSTRLADGRVLIVGGVINELQAVPTVEVFR